MATPHNSAELGQIAKTVIMPGDPLRAQYLAEHYLENVELVTKVRNMFGYTGTYHGKQISVMGSGMGMPSVGIYSYELYKFYDVDRIIRVGSAGSYCEECKIYDTILVTESYSESSYAKVQSGYQKDITYPSENLCHIIRTEAEKLGKSLKEGRIHSTDVFYKEGNPNYYQELYQNKNCLGVEMESFALFHNAAVCGKEAACILTISDSFVSKEVTTAEERQKSFTDMIEIALEAAIT